MPSTFPPICPSGIQEPDCEAQRPSVHLKTVCIALLEIVASILNKAKQLVCNTPIATPTPTRNSTSLHCLGEALHHDGKKGLEHTCNISSIWPSYVVAVTKNWSPSSTSFPLLWPDRKAAGKDTLSCLPATEIFMESGTTPRTSTVFPSLLSTQALTCFTISLQRSVAAIFLLGLVKPFLNQVRRRRIPKSEHFLGR